MKAGLCPKVQEGVAPVCKKRCDKDADCDGIEQKCCDVGCGTRTCVKVGKLCYIQERARCRNTYIVLSVSPSFLVKFLVF